MIYPIYTYMVLRAPVLFTLERGWTRLTVLEILSRRTRKTENLWRDLKTSLQPTHTIFREKRAG